MLNIGHNSYTLYLFFQFSYLIFLPYNILNSNLAKLQHGGNIVGNVRGTYGSCDNLVCTSFLHDEIAILTCKMNACSGVFDISLSDFGLPKGSKIAQINNDRLATHIIGTDGNLLNVNSVANETSLQIACGSTADSYNFMFPVFIE